MIDALFRASYNPEETQSRECIAYSLAKVSAPYAPPLTIVSGTKGRKETMSMGGQVRLPTIANLLFILIFY